MLEQIQLRINQRQIIEEVINLVSSFEGETILVCNFLIAYYIMDSTAFNVKYENPKISKQLLHIGNILGKNLFIDYAMDCSDLRIIIRYKIENLRKINIDNLLNGKSNKTENSVDLSQYINIS